MDIYTIGHSTRPIEEFVGLLKQYGIECLADIRRWPSSRKWPQFNRPALQESMEAAGIEYEWIEDLGGRRHKTADPHSPNTGLTSPGFRNYADYMLTDQFREAIDRLIAEASEKTIAIMCAERLFWKCHRKLVSDFLVSLGIRVLHIIDERTLHEHKPTSYAHVEPGRVTYPAQQHELF